MSPILHIIKKAYYCVLKLVYTLTKFFIAFIYPQSQSVMSDTLVVTSPSSIGSMNKKNATSTPVGSFGISNTTISSNKKYEILDNTEGILDATTVANYFIRKAIEKNDHTMTHMKLMKLVYIAYGWYIALENGKPLFNDRIEAWKYGPVIPTLYEKLKKYGTQRIDQVIDNRVICDSEIKEYLDSIFDLYSSNSAFQLSDLTHQKGTPWSITYYINKGVHNIEIKPDLIRSYYANLLK